MPTTSGGRKPKPKSAPAAHPAAASPWPAGVGAPAQRALAAAGYTQLEQLAGVREADLLRLHGFGPKSLPPLRAALAAQGLHFAD